MRYLILWIIVLVIALIGLSAWVIGFIAYDFSPTLEDTQEVTGLSSTVYIDWSDTKTPFISAQSEADLFVGLGYAHTLSHSWAMVLWRQTALGKLGLWFGDSTKDYDQLIHELGIEARAKAAYRSLPLPEQVALDAYTRGVNTILEKNPGNYPTDLLVTEIQPEPWENWHSIAIEQLITWLGTSPTTLPTDSLQSAVSTFLEKDQALHDFLLLDGFQNSMAWTYQHNNNAYFFQRHVYGKSALPLFQNVQLAWGQRHVTALSIPGTLMFPAGKNETFAWHISLTSPLTITPSDAVEKRIKPTYSIFKNQHLDETLVKAYRTDSTLFLPERLAINDSTEVNRAWGINWSGFQRATALQQWRALLNAKSDSLDFTPLKGDGMIFSKQGVASVLGSPPLQKEYARGHLIASSEWGTPLLKTLTYYARKGTSPSVFLNPNYQGYSAWAEALGTPYITALDTLKNIPFEIYEAVDYLSNWTFEYDKANIGASLFDTWMTTYFQDNPSMLFADSTTALPSDSLGRALTVAQLQKSLARTIQKLAVQTNTAEQSRWRWEYIQPDSCQYPIWANKQIALHHKVFASTRFSPIRIGDSGHPSALFWRASFLGNTENAPAAWEGWLHQNKWDTWTVQQNFFFHEAFLEKHLSSTRRKQVMLSDKVKQESLRTTLLPL